jgi:hypothetical protein
MTSLSTDGLPRRSGNASSCTRGSLRPAITAAVSSVDPSEATITSQIKCASSLASTLAIFFGRRAASLKATMTTETGCEFGCFVVRNGRQRDSANINSG